MVEGPWLVSTVSLNAYPNKEGGEEGGPSRSSSDRFEIYGGSELALWRYSPRGGKQLGRCSTQVSGDGRRVDHTAS